ncbi:MAG: SpoIIE family protein phosphatase [Deltaproteobacteria bacterium]|nr:SpoIIE family protein phosphatase [Deltaproteobacteria bacterium]
MDDLTKMTIVAVDDDSLSLRFIGRLFQNRGYTNVQGFSSSLQALDYVLENPPDLLLLDLIMPELGGLEFCRKIRNSQAFSRVPIVMITSNNDEHTLRTCFEAGATDFIGKPFSPTEFLARVKSALSLKRSNDLLKAQLDEITTLSRHIQRDLDLAEKIFTNIIYQEPSYAPNIRFTMSPASKVSGDIFFVTSTPVGIQHILLGDFTGHGLPAAIGASAVPRIFYSMSANGHPINKIMDKINEKLRCVLPLGFFCCACIVSLDKIKGKARILNCGLPEVLLIGRQGGIKRRFFSQYPPLGIEAAIDHSTLMEEITIYNGDHLFIYSDGLIETANPEGELFGQSRLEEVLSGVYDAAQGFDEVRKALLNFRTTAGQDDDITLADIKCVVKSLTSRHHGQSQDTDLEIPDWDISVCLNAPKLTGSDMAGLVYDAMAHKEPSLIKQMGDIYLLLSELYNNALEHGVLELDSRLKATPDGFGTYCKELSSRLAVLDRGSIKIEARYYSLGKNKMLVIRVEDSGPGFDYRKDHSLLLDEKAFSGRGIALVRSLCQELIYCDPGNIAEAVYVWQEYPE